MGGRSGNDRDPGQLKFITSNDDFYPAFVASEADKEVDSGGGSYDLSYCGDEYCGNDNKFKFLSGKYKIEVELGLQGLGIMECCIWWEMLFQTVGSLVVPKT